jgi:hypothetical protein
MDVLHETIHIHMAITQDMPQQAHQIICLHQANQGQLMHHGSQHNHLYAHTYYHWHWLMHKATPHL